MKKLWEGRIDGKKDASVESFNASIGFDKRLYNEDIIGSIAHAKMLSKIGVLTVKEYESIASGLEAIRQDITAGKFTFTEELEDIHTHIETALRERIGDAAGKLHTARSRNDQINVDMRLYLKKYIDEIVRELISLEKTLHSIAAAHTKTVMPGYTHLQPAQPMVLSHLMLAYFFMISRDIGRLNDCAKRLDMLTLGSGAFAGVNYPIERDMVRSDLGFARISENALDSVSDRDFIAEFLAGIAILFTHLSRIAEDFIIFNSNEYRFVELADGYTTGSSIMPNKKNPDMLELTRGKCGRVFGDLISVLTLMKGLPSAYNKDLQEDKEPMFDAIDTALATIPIVRAVLETAAFDKERMRESCDRGYMTAVEIADYLVAKGLPFREAHNIVGRIVRHAVTKKKTFAELTIAEYKSFSDNIGDDIYDAVKPEQSIQRKVSMGSTGEASIKAQLVQAQGLIERFKSDIKSGSY
ncbi:MAG: argininosuccinate lyase [Spirochaetes bacterium]|nr:argininosuccinate lyase [Spirochaetota bacterium]